MDLRQRINKARSDASMTQEELASAVGKTRGAVAQWESGDVRPRHATLAAVAKATGKSLQWLESGVDEANVGLRVVGEVAAGMWREGSVEFKQYGQPVAPHPDYPADAQRLYKVSGNSVNKYVLDGEFIHTVDVQSGAITPESGDLVIVRRTEHGLSEYTAKRLIREPNRTFLRPESNDADWQQDIEVDGNEATEIEIVDVIIAKWCPLRKSRAS